MVHTHSIQFLRLFLFFFHSTNTIIVSFLPLLYKSNSLTGFQIGVLLAIGPLASIISQPFWGYWSDKYRSVKRFIIICLLGLLCSSIFLFQQNSFLLFLLLTPIFFSFMGPVGALGDSLASKTADIKRVAFGSIRTWGSIGFASTSLVTGFFLAQYGIGQFLYIYLFYAILTLISSLFLSDMTVSEKRISFSDTRKIVQNKQLLLFLVVLLLLAITHRTNDSFIGLYINELGGRESLIGWAWFIGVTTEAIVFAMSYKWFRGYHEITFIVIAGAIYTVRWFIYAQVTNPYWTLPLQVLHGLTFPIFYIAAFQYVTKIIPKEIQSTGHLLFLSVFFGLSGILGSMLGGTIIEYFNGNILYFLLGLLSLLGTIFFILYAKKSNIPLFKKYEGTRKAEAAR